MMPAELGPGTDHLVHQHGSMETVLLLERLAPYTLAVFGMGERGTCTVDRAGCLLPATPRALGK